MKENLLKSESSKSPGQDLKIKILCWLIFFVTYFFFKTIRVRFENDHFYQDLKKRGDASGHYFAYAFWHCNSFSCMISHAGRHVAPMVSDSKDGEIASFVANKLGMRCVRGSTTRNGQAAREELERLSKDRWSPAFAVDGPRGPARQVKSGVVSLAANTGVSILPLSAISSSYWTLKSWDRLRIPKPFSTVTVRYGQPMTVDLATDDPRYQKEREHLRLLLESLELS